MGDCEKTFVEYENSLRAINRAAETNPEAFVLETERAYQNNIRKIAAQIAQGEPLCKLVMLAGPSSSGKTTTAHRLADAIAEQGVASSIISLDDFYLGEDQAPLLPNGQRDYESVEALDLEDIQQCLFDLVQNSRSDLPVFDFHVHMPFPYRRHLELGEREVAVVEGIHALNPLLVSRLPELRVQKIYISVKQGVHDDGAELVGPNEMRLVRRIVRDFHFRNASPETEFRMWPNVMEGERKYIKPFRKDADFTINSLHAYEPCVLKGEAVELLHTVPVSSPLYGDAEKLLAGLERFQPIDPALVPKNSILREFIGGGVYD